MMMPTSGWSTNCPRFRKRRTLATEGELCNDGGQAETSQFKGQGMAVRAQPAHGFERQSRPSA